MDTVRIGLIGTGWMGKAHINAFLNARMLFGIQSGNPVFHTVAGHNKENTEKAAKDMGFLNWTTDWKELIENPEIDLIDITTPNVYHYEMAKAALKAGKHVYCEKPLCLLPEQSLELAELAREKGVVNYVGFNNVMNPANQYVRELVQAHKLGEIMRAEAVYDQDALLDPKLPITWRHKNELAGCGTLGDMCTHVLSILKMILGDMKQVTAIKRTVIPKRPIKAGSDQMQLVENEDFVMFLAEYHCGAIASIGSSRVATGRKNFLSYEIQGTEGTVYYNLERMGEVQVYFRNDHERDRGFRTVLMNPKHPGYSVFQPQAGISLAFNDMKVLEIHELMNAVTKQSDYLCDFSYGAEIDSIVAAVLRSCKSGQWTSVTGQGTAYE